MATRNWFVAIGEMGGEFDGNPLSFEASEMYGPYTFAQAKSISDMGDFPHATKAIEIIPANRLPIRALKKLVKQQLAAAKADQDEEDERIEGFKKQARFDKGDE
jgi:hypothetical protein